MKDLLKNKKLLIVLGIIILVLVVVTIVLVNKGNDNKQKQEEKVTLEQKLTQYGKKYYDEYYYPIVNDKNELGNFDNGINITITNLDVIYSLDSETDKLMDERKCDYDKTVIVYYPKSPYGANDYEIKVELACDK